MKDQKKPKRTEKKAPQKTLKERRVEKRAASAENARDARSKT